MLERLNPCDNRNCLCEFMQAGFRPGEGYFEDIADLIVLAAKMQYSRVLNWIKHIRKKRILCKDKVGECSMQRTDFSNF